MKNHERTENQKKIIAAMEIVYENLIAYKKKIDSELAVLQDGKIVRIKPWL
jgi:ABC-type metal ion transport system substrate-binding protein